MNWSAIFIHRPVATVLLALAIVLSGLVAFQLLPVASLPQVDFPNIEVSADLPGAGPEIMASSVATPLERALGRIDGITEMTSSSTQGSTRINLQFDLDRDIDSAARDVQAAINAARGLLPSSLPTNPKYKKSTPAGSPVMVIALTSTSRSKEQLYDVAFTVLAQKISQIRGVGQVNVNGSSLPSVRVEVNPAALNHYGISGEQVRTALAAANVNQPKGAIEKDDQRWQIYVNDQSRKARDYRDLIVAWRDEAPVHLSDIADVKDSVQDLRNAATSAEIPAVLITVFNQPSANIVETVDAIKGLLPQLQDSIPGDVDMQVVNDRTKTIRASLSEVEHTLLISVLLVVLVVYLFLRNGRATIIPAVAIPVSLLGTLVVIYLLGYSLNNLSLMALIIATGFVVDDAIVVLENTIRHIENGLAPMAAALRGVREVGFTVLAMSVSLTAVFIPLLFMGGIIGRLFREFAVTLSVAVGVSLLVSLSLTPMMSARLLRAESHSDKSQQSLFTQKLHEIFEKFLAGMSRRYEGSLTWALRHSRLMLLLLLATVSLNIYLFMIVPKGFFPEQDTGRLRGFLLGDQSSSFTSMREKTTKLMQIIGADPDIATYYEFSSGFGGQGNTGTVYALLKPRAERKATASEIVTRLRPQLATVPGVNLYLSPQQDISIGGRPTSGLYQYSLLSSELSDLRLWTPRLKEAFSHLPELTDVNSDMQDAGLQMTLKVDRHSAARLGVSAKALDAALNDIFGQRLVSTIYEPLNQYYVVLTAAPKFIQSTAALEQLYVKSDSVKSDDLKDGKGNMVPLSAFSRYEMTNAPLSVNHEGQFAASTLSFGLAPNVSLSQATLAIDRVFEELSVPTSVHGNFAGTAKEFNASIKSQPWLILAALITAYIVLGILYESYLHPLTILSTLPSAGVGAILALMVCRTELSIIALIGIFLLIGVVKKNAIIMVDFALQVERDEGLSSRDAIYKACVLRFRPILMTTLAAMLGALPLALALGDGSELRRPLGISIVGGLMVSQLLTLFTTPVVYLYVDKLRLWGVGWRQRRLPQLAS